MKRLVLAILLLMLTTLLVPGLRQRVQPQIDASRAWLGETLENGPLRPVFTRYRTLKTQATIDEAIRNLVRNRNLGQHPPAPDDFKQFLTRSDLSTTDGWGAPLLLSQEPDSVAIISAGPDMEYYTADDLVTKLRYRAPPRRNLLRRR